jgi:SAM-dependent methyltransferase
MQANDNADLKRIYSQRFSGATDYRNKVWQILIRHFFCKFIPLDATILDLGCGYGEFINNVQAACKYGMDLNPDSPTRLNPDVKFLYQDCSERWQIPDHSLDVVFTSNFFEHLPDKTSLGKTLDEVHRCLKPGGSIIAMGPNIKYLPGAYWDFWDHYLPLTDLALTEALETREFKTDVCIGRFLPYTMAGKRQTPAAIIKAYLALPVAWPFFGKQFLVVARS